MKNLLLYIVCFLMIFKSAAAYTEPTLPEDFVGTETRKVISAKINDDTYETTLTQNFNMFYEISSYLYQKYSWEELHKEDFIEKLRQFYPDDSEAELQKKHGFLLRVYGIYKLGKDVYVKFANKYLVPHAYRKVRDASEYDHPHEVAYVPAPDDEYVKVYNFKKFLTYSENDDERNAIAEFERKQKDNDDFLTQFERIIEKVEWNKVLFYGVTYDNPLFSNAGVGTAYYGDGFNARLLSRNTYTEQKDVLDFGLQIVTNPAYFVLANDLSAEWQKPQIDFSQSENIADVQILYPLPHQTDTLPQAYKYFGNFLIPLKVTPRNKTADINLKTEVTLTLCDFELNCQPQSVNLQLPLQVYGADKFDNGFDNLFFHALNRNPSADNPYLKLKRFALTDTPEGKQLYLEMETSKKIKSFYAYIEDTAGYTEFAEPRYILAGNTLKVFFAPLNRADADTLAANEFIVSANLNNRYFYRDRIVPQLYNENLPTKAALKRNFILTAFVSGLCLNFLPFAAPFVLMLLIVFIRLNKRNPEILRSRQLQILKGTLTGMLLVFGFLLSRKHNGEMFIWGIQFNHPAVAVCLLFVLAAVIKLLPSLLSHLTDSAAAKRGATFCYAYGLGLGLLLLWGVSPYLSALMNLALALPILSACGIAGGIICGFCIIQLLLIYLPSKPKLWHQIDLGQREIVLFIRYALYISLGWILLFIVFRHGFFRSLIFIALLIIWSFLCFIYQKFLEFMRGGLNENIIPYIPKIHRGGIIFMSIIFAAIAVSGIHIADKYQQKAEVAIADIQDYAEIKADIRQNKPLLLTFEADWCFNCHFKRFWTFNPYILKQWQERYNLQTKSLTDNRRLAEYMQKYKQYALPFYVLYTPRYPQGLVLSPQIDEIELETLLN